MHRSVTTGEKLYVLGGENEQPAHFPPLLHLIRKRKTWEEFARISVRNVSGICKASLISDKNEIYVIGGQTGTGANAAALKNIYVFHAESKKWTTKADMKEAKNQFGHSRLRRQKVYVFSKAGATDKLDVYDLDADTWESAVMPGTSTILGGSRG